MCVNRKAKKGYLEEDMFAGVFCLRNEEKNLCPVKQKLVQMSDTHRYHASFPACIRVICVL